MGEWPCFCAVVHRRDAKRFEPDRAFLVREESDLNTTHLPAGGSWPCKLPYLRTPSTAELSRPRRCLSRRTRRDFEAASHVIPDEREVGGLLAGLEMKCALDVGRDQGPPTDAFKGSHYHEVATTLRRGGVPVSLSRKEAERASIRQNLFSLRERDRIIYI